MSGDGPWSVGEGVGVPHRRRRQTRTSPPRRCGCASVGGEAFEEEGGRWSTTNNKQQTGRRGTTRSGSCHPSQRPGRPSSNCCWTSGLSHGPPSQSRACRPAPCLPLPAGTGHADTASLPHPGGEHSGMGGGGPKQSTDGGERANTAARAGWCPWEVRLHAGSTPRAASASPPEPVLNMAALALSTRCFLCILTILTN